jgi:hypothetical protein
MREKIREFSVKFINGRNGVIAMTLLVFLFAAGVRALPLLHKKYPIDNDAVQMTLARNLYLGLGYKMETADGVILATSLVAERAMPASNPYVGISLGYYLLFKLFGFQPNLFLPIVTTVAAHAFLTALFFLLARKMTNISVAFIFVIFDTLMPVIMEGSLAPELYEFAMPLFAVGMLLYLYGKGRPAIWRLVLAGVFFTLSIFARNAMMFSYGAFVVYEFWQNKSYKRALMLILPGIVIAGGALLYAIPKNYATGFAGGMIGKTTFPSQFYLHIYPDAYTYKYDQAGYFAAGGQLNSSYNEPFMRYGRHYSLKEYVAAYARPISSTLLGFFPLIVWGGPLILILLLFGAIFLHKEKRDIFNLLAIWFVVWLTGLFFARTSNWTHYLELEFIFVLTISFGVYKIFELLLKSGLAKKYQYVLIGAIMALIAAHLLDANKWMLHEQYRGDKQETVAGIAQNINDRHLSAADVIAVGLEPRTTFIFNYYTNLNYVYFNPETLDRLLKEGRVAEAFGKYKVNYVLGYSPELTSRLVAAVKVKNLASDFYAPEEKHYILFGQ